MAEDPSEEDGEGEESEAAAGPSTGEGGSWKTARKKNRRKKKKAASSGGQSQGCGQLPEEGIVGANAGSETAAVTSQMTELRVADDVTPVSVSERAGYLSIPCRFSTQAA